MVRLALGAIDPATSIRFRRLVAAQLVLNELYSLHQLLHLIQLLRLVASDAFFDRVDSQRELVEVRAKIFGVLCGARPTGSRRGLRRRRDFLEIGSNFFESLS